MDNIFEDEPSWLERLGKSQCLKCRRTALFGARLRSLCTRMVRAFGGGKQKVDLSDLVSELSGIDMLQLVGDDLGVLEVVGKRGCGDRAEINSTDDLGASSSGAVAAPSTSTEYVQCSDHDLSPRRQSVTRLPSRHLGCQAQNEGC